MFLENMFHEFFQSVNCIWTQIIIIIINVPNNNYLTFILQFCRTIYKVFYNFIEFYLLLKVLSSYYLGEEKKNLRKSFDVIESEFIFFILSRSNFNFSL